MTYTLYKKRDSILHWNMTFFGGFLGIYAILQHAGTFGSAQTGNLLEMAEDMVSMDWKMVLLRLMACFIFGTAIVLSHLLTNYTQLPMQKLVLLVDAAAITSAALLPIPLDPVVRLYPIFFCAAFQWSTYTGAWGCNSSSIFITNNFKQSVLGWTQYFITRDTSFRRKAILYTFAVISFFAGACFGAICIHRFGEYGAFGGLIPLLTAWLLLSKDMIRSSENFSIM